MSSLWSVRVTLLSFRVGPLPAPGSRVAALVGTSLALACEAASPHLAGHETAGVWRGCGLPSRRGVGPVTRGGELVGARAVMRGCQRSGHPWVELAVVVSVQVRLGEFEVAVCVDGASDAPLELLGRFLRVYCVGV